MTRRRPRQAGQAKRALLGGALGLLALCGSILWACSTPVFRYALERWEAEPYGVILFHRGPLGARDQAIADALAKGAMDYDRPVNYIFAAIDLDADPSEPAKKLWQAQSGAQLPWLVVRYPLWSQIEGNVWAGKPSALAIRSLATSPVRRDIARRIARGASVVWILLESGTRSKDDAAAKLLEQQLKHLEQAIELPAPPPDWGFAPGEEPPPALKVAFSIVRLSRADPAEQMLVSMLLHSEPDLTTFSEPMVFPVFGRARALCALVGAGINKENIQDIVFFLVGPCLCEVKGSAPGVDLLMATDWLAVIDQELVQDEPPPPLTGLSEFVEQARAEQAQPPADTPSGGVSGPLVRNVALSVVCGLAVLAIAAFFVVRKGRPVRS